MIDGLHAPQSVLLLGGTSDIGLAIVARLADGGRLRRVVLAGRPGRRLDEAAEQVRAHGVDDVEVVDFDATAPADHAEVAAAAFAKGDIDVTVVAAGVLPDQAAMLADPASSVAVLTANYVGPVSMMLWVAQRLREQGHGVLVVLSSVAGERPRRSNFVYGSTKAGLDAVATGLGDELAGSGASVLVVRPGFVRSRMTAGLAAAPLATDPAAVADAVAAQLGRGTRTVWVPGLLRWVMLGLRVLPRAVFRRLPL
ncbi:decaprenylphospho-beta-D-erythro-pentofuranosid-2-ulose 2-reductase [uncultured Jatrophihabitans sp.]|uniref:decaprenylphospho-beta-D-erythro-pentofuranosid- 2-ulose 2-reductase n=1 Tax=uncultured Jatrophihabitans sp. TaxID=1610747 RepID=UPI0035CC2C0D